MTDNGEPDVLQHLLQVESQASGLVDEAQAEADRRVAESEKENRARYDERYSREAAKLNGAYETAVLAVKEDYTRQLDAYRESLSAMPVDRAAFSALAERLFFGDR
jgi:F0F1-type ATP synthase membrane subunit b/b'